MINFSGNTTSQLHFAGGYTQEQLAQRKLNAALKSKDPQALLSILSLPNSQSPLYDKEYDQRDGEYYAKNSERYNKVEQALIQLIQDPSVPKTKIEALDRIFQEGDTSYDVSDAVAEAINTRLSGNS